MNNKSTQVCGNNDTPIGIKEAKIDLVFVSISEICLIVNLGVVEAPIKKAEAFTLEFDKEDFQPKRKAPQTRRAPPTPEATVKTSMVTAATKNLSTSKHPLRQSNKPPVK